MISSNFFFYFGESCFRWMHLYEYFGDERDRVVFVYMSQVTTLELLFSAFRPIESATHESPVTSNVAFVVAAFAAIVLSWNWAIALTVETPSECRTGWNDSRLTIDSARLRLVYLCRCLFDFFPHHFSCWCSASLAFSLLASIAAIIFNLSLEILIEPLVDR